MLQQRLTITADETLMTPGGNKTRPQRSHEGVAGATLPSWIEKVKSHIREQIFWLLKLWLLKLSCLFNGEVCVRSYRSTC